MMPVRPTPLALLKAAVAAFKTHSCTYCLIGGHASSLYRSQERLTRDVDFALVSSSPESSQKLAEEVIRELGFEPMIGFIPLAPREPKRNSVCMITSKPLAKESRGLIDILLPALPWLPKAVERAQFNLINLGFATVPVITPEDLIIAKCYALRNAPDRFQDLDDLKEIFLSVKDLDRDYLTANLSKLSLALPEQIKKFADRNH